MSTVLPEGFTAPEMILPRAFYETAAEEGLINYDDYVQYPFGHGLSYTGWTRCSFPPPGYSRRSPS